MADLDTLAGGALVFSVIVGSFVALVNIATQAESIPVVDDCDGFDPVSIAFCITDLFTAFFGIVLDALTFNVEGAPSWIRVPMGALIIASLVYVLAKLALS